MASNKKESKKTNKEDKGKKNTSFRLDQKTLKALKLRAIQQDSSIQSILEQLVKGYLNGIYKID